MGLPVRMQSDIASADAAAGLRVLVVEDDYFLAETLHEELCERGVDVVGPAGALEDAEALLEPATRIDAAVLDVNLGGVMTFGLADRLLQDGVRVVFTTGYDAAALPERFRRVRVCAKPYSIESIIAALAHPGG